MKNGVLLTATIVVSLLTSTQAVAGASANIGVTSNYLWRAQTQSNDKAAIQAGLDYSAENGLYVGTWASSEEFATKGTELDIYAGYKKELANGITTDVGVIQYRYPNDNANEFSEAYVKLGYKGVGFEYDNTIQTKDSAINAKGDQYYSLGYTGSLPNDWSYGAKLGRYDYKQESSGWMGDYTHTQLSLTKTTKTAGDFTLAIDKASKPDSMTLKDDARASLSWKKTFDF